MRAMLTTALLLGSNLAMAADWNPIGETSDSTWYIDRQSLGTSDGKAKAWFIVDLANERTDYAGRKFKSSKELVYFDCSARTSATLYHLTYSDQLGEGNTVWSSSVDKKNVTYLDVVPDSIGETLLDLVCSSVPKPQKRK
jgi:hypothetical protein